MKHYCLCLLIVFSFVANAQPVMNPITGATSRCSAPTPSIGYGAAASGSPISYSWAVTPTVPITYNNPQSVYFTFPASNTSNPTTYTISCTATNASGTSAPAHKVVTVYNTQIATFLGSQTICKGSGTTLTVTTPFSFSSVNYSWTPATFLSSSSSGTVVASPTANITYSVYVDDFKCPWENHVSISVSDCVNMEELSESISPQLTVFPNPSHDGLMHLISAKKMDARIINMQGEVIRTIHLVEGQEYNVTGLSAGFYIIAGADKSSKLVIVQPD